jgi:hypothetical protein
MEMNIQHTRTCGIEKSKGNKGEAIFRREKERKNNRNHVRGRGQMKSMETER